MAQKKISKRLKKGKKILATKNLRPTESVTL
jgi:hypothetical protein